MQIDGALTIATISERWSSLAEATLTAKQIDVTNLAEFDSAGLACLTALKRASGGALKLCGANTRVLALADTYGVTELFEP